LASTTWVTPKSTVTDISEIASSSLSPFVVIGAPSQFSDGITPCNLRPEGFRRQARAFDKSSQFGPGQIGVNPTAEAAIRAGDDILAAGDRGVAQNAVGDQLGVFDKVSGVADDARHQDLLLEGFKQPTYRGMRINGERVRVWSSTHGRSGR
jgi:hypothetical protein